MFRNPLEKESACDVKLDDSKQKMILSCDTPFELLNENHVFEALGLTQTNEEELDTLFEP